MDDVEGAIAAEGAPAAAEHPEGGILAEMLAAPAEEPEADFDPYALADERVARETSALQRALFEHELYAAYPSLRGHDAALTAAAAQVGELPAGDPATIRETARKLGAAAAKLVADIREQVVRDQGRAMKPRTAGIGGASMPPGIVRKKAEPKPVSMCEAIRARQRRFRLY